MVKQIIDSLEIDILDIVVSDIEAVLELSKPSSFRITGVSSKKLDDCCGKKIIMKFRLAKFILIVTSQEIISKTEEQNYEYCFLLSDPLFLLSIGWNSRSFKNRSTKEIVDIVFKENSISIESTIPSSEKINCIQFDESDENFLNKMIYVVGFVYFYNHEKNSAQVVHDKNHFKEAKIPKKTEINILELEGFEQDPIKKISVRHRSDSGLELNTVEIKNSSKENTTNKKMFLDSQHSEAWTKKILQSVKRQSEKLKHKKILCSHYIADIGQKIEGLIVYKLNISILKKSSQNFYFTYFLGGDSWIPEPHFNDYRRSFLAVIADDDYESSAIDKEGMIEIIPMFASKEESLPCRFSTLLSGKDHGLLIPPRGRQECLVQPMDCIGSALILIAILFNKNHVVCGQKNEITLTTKVREGEPTQVKFIEHKENGGISVTANLFKAKHKDYSIDVKDKMEADIKKLQIKIDKLTMEADKAECNIKELLFSCSVFSAEISKMTISAKEKINMKGPSITMEGSKIEISGSIKLKGSVEVSGSLKIGGTVDVSAGGSA